MISRGMTRGGVWGFRGLGVVVLVWSFASVCLARETDLDEIAASVRAAQAELARLLAKDVGELEALVRAKEAELERITDVADKPAVFQEYRKLEAQWWDVCDQLWEVEEPFEAKMGEIDGRLWELREQPDVDDWLGRIEDKAEEMDRVLYAYRQARQGDLQHRGRALHERRRAELAGVAVVDVPHAAALGYGALDYPRVDGSRSTQSLGTIIACKMLGSAYRWAGTARYSGVWNIEDRSVETYGLVFGSMLTDLAAQDTGPAIDRRAISLIGYRAIATAADPPRLEDARLSLVINRMLSVHSGTHGAYENVITGRSDIVLVERRPSAVELARAQRSGIELEVAAFALDAFVFIANHKNVVTDLSTAQIRDIYSGQLTNWIGVGGPDVPITAYQREQNSGSQELMETLVMKDVPFMEPTYRGWEQLYVLYGKGAPYIRLNRDTSGLGYSGFYYERFMAGSPDTKVVAVDGVMPSYETIRDGRYPYVTEVYVVMRKGADANSDAAKFKAWLLSEEGQAVVRESGYVPLQAAAKGE